jgi:gentisate 1,2-dioxygenase
MDARLAPPVDMADLPVQLPSAPTTAAQARARFFNSGNAFNIVLPAVPARAFDEVAAQALAATRSAWFDCDQSAALGCDFAATTPLMLARYARVAPGDSLAVDAVATGLIGYVIAGDAYCSGGDAELMLAAGDVVLLPGGPRYRLHGGASGALLWLVGNQPQLAFDGSRPGRPPLAAVDVVHYPAAEIARQLDALFAAGRNDTTSGHALIFSSARHEAGRNLMPTLTLSLNTLPPQAAQRAHRHNSAAITLIVQGQGCHSMVAGQRCDWTPWTTMVTPPGAPHSHHNDGEGRALFLIVQDGGLHYHARTMGFEFLAPADPSEHTAT